MITFESLTQEEKYSRALGEIYKLLLKLAQEKEKERKVRAVDPQTHDCTLPTEYPSEV